MSTERFHVMAVFATLLLLVGLVAGTVAMLDRTWHTAWRGTEIALDRTSRAAENIVNRQFLQVDGALANVATLVGPVTTAEQAESAGRLLRSLNFQSFAFRDLLVVDARGNVLTSARPRPKGQSLPLGNFAPEATIVSRILGPMRNVMTGDWVLYMVRPLGGPGGQGHFAVAEITTGSLMTALSSVAEMPGLRIMITHQDGRLLTSLPHEELQIGEVVQLDAEVRHSRRGQGPFDAMLALFGQPAAEEHLSLVRPTLYPDIRVALTLKAQVAMAEWTRDRDQILMMRIVAFVLLCALALVLAVALTREQRLEAERRSARERMEGALEAMSDGFVMWDAEDRLVTCNRRYRELYALSSDLIVPGAHFADIIRKGAERGQYPQAGDDIEGFVQGVLDWHTTAEGSLERLLPDGRWLLITERRTANGGIVGIRTDITALKHALEELAVANERAREAMQEVQRQNDALRERDQALHTQNLLFDAALNNMSQGLLMVGADQRVIVGNRRFAELMGLDPEAGLHGLSLPDLFGKLFAGGRYPASIVQDIRTWQMKRAVGVTSGSLVAACADGQALAVTQQPMADGGFVATYEDVTERQQNEQRIRFLAHHDALTQLPNRVLFRNRLEALLPKLATGGEGLALLYLDLDEFKDVNDMLGHPVGDALLGAVAERLRGCLRERDVVARLGGDEFAIALVARDVEQAAALLGERIIAEISKPYDLQGRQVTIGVSVGAAITRDAAADPDELLKNADLALYQAKERGRGRYCRFEAGMAERLHARLEIETELRVAVAQDQLALAYQPLVGLTDGKTLGFEALLRWNHPTRGQVGPGDFIPLAEDIGLIGEIGAWCLERACADVVSMPGWTKVAVNLSPVQLKSGDLVGTVMRVLRDTGLDPGRLELEITESALLDDDERIMARLHRLRDAGIRIVLDDFGTGYSSLNYLRRFPFHKIKIDQVFVREATSRADCSAIIRSVVDLADRLGMATTAEGIETAEQLALVRELGCGEGQGYLLGRPGPLLTAMARFGDHGLTPVVPARSQRKRRAKA